jgi:tetratricopeptide (TPR) repeat protein/tRNA A-37 threonylcarbamoyl transferase component Bud32
MMDFINNRYQVEKTIGQGGMGTVYRAYDRLTGQHVALKRVTAPQNTLELASRLTVDETMSMALANEFRTLASLHHPHIISVLDYGFEANLQPFFTMRLLENALPIDKYAANCSPSEKIGLLSQILQALNYLHRRGILHRDLKPSNVLTEAHHAYLLDFGLALDAAYAHTRGDAAGTLAYLAPEVLQGTMPSIASDLYSFGVLAYEILIGEHPFPSKSNSELIHKVLTEAVRVDSARLNDGLAMVMMRLLSKDPADRYVSTLETLRALAEAGDYPLPQESEEIRESFLVAANFVGREEEIQVLSSALEAAIAGKGQSYLIAGESGVGKSRLMDELRSRGLVRGFMALRGQAVSEGGLPYQLWREIIRNLLLMVTINDEEAFILKLLVPDIETLLGRQIADFSFDSITMQKRLPIILLNLLSEAAKKRPLLLLLEDLQWAGESIEVLKLISQGIGFSPILIVANYRSDESPHLPETLGNMNLINLPRLSEASIRELSQAMLGETGSQDNVVELIQRETEGNAFFIVEVVRALAEEAGQLGDIGRSTLPAQVFAGGVKRIIERRISRLPEWALAASQVAAVIGREVKPGLMQTILPTLKLESWLNAAGEAVVLTATGETWQFAHDKLREYLLESLPDAERRTIHLQVAKAIESLYAENLSDYVVLLVQHFGAGADEKKEAHYAVEAAKLLREANPREARHYVKRALALKAEELAENPQEALASLHLLLAKTHIRLNDYDEARESLKISSTIYEELGDAIGLAITKQLLGEVGFYTGKLTEALPILQEALTVLEQTEDWHNIGYCYMNIGIIYGRQRDMATARSYFEKCLEAMEKTGDSMVIAQALNNLGISYDMQGEWDKAIELYNRSLSIRREIKDKRGIAYSLVNLAALAFDQNRYEDAREMRLEALRLVREMGDRMSEANVLDGMGNLENAAGNYDKGLAYYKDALVLAQQIGDVHLVPMILLNIGKLEEKTGLDGKRSFDAALLAASKSDILPNKEEVLFQIALWNMEKGDKISAGRILTSISANHKDAAAELESLKAEMNLDGFAIETIDEMIEKLLKEASHE